MQEKLRNGPTTSSFEDRLDNLKDSVRNLVGSGSERAKSAATSSGRLVKDHPIATIAIIAGIGVGVGVFLFLRRR